MISKYIHIFIIFIGYLVFSDVKAQENGFRISSDKDKLTIPFTSINNLIFIEVAVNGVPMVFLLDSGVDKTILFSLEEVEEVRFSQAEKATFRGLGNDLQSVEGLKTSNNTLSITEHFVDNNHDIYILLDQDFNISSGLGVPVNGILGFDFFKNHIIEIDYVRNKIHVYNDLNKIRKKIDRKFKKLNFSIENGKPYLTAEVILNDYKDRLKLLIDTGNGDAVWLFQDKIPGATVPENHFEDFLGRGFNGEVHGKRAKLDKITFYHYTFEQPYVAFPDTLSIQNVKMVQDRAGSLGAEILRRFTVVFDYRNQAVYLRPNSQYDESFHFNMSGIEVQHSGMEWTKVAVPVFQSEEERNLMTDLLSSYSYTFELKPVFKIYSIRKNSPAAIAGLLKDDEILSINGKKAYKFSLQEIRNLLQSKEGKKIRFEIKRNNKVLKYTFNLKSIL